MSALLCNLALYQTFLVNCLIYKAILQGKYNDMVGDNMVELLSVQHIFVS